MSPSDRNLQIVSWNARSLNGKLSELKVHMYSKKPHIICIQETWGSAGFEPKFINYSGIFKHRINRRGGGLAFIVRNDIVVTPSQLQNYQNGVLECQRVVIKLLGSTLDILNIYNPNQVVSVAEWRHYLQQMSNEAIIVGDFNAHHPLWTHRVNRGCPTARNLISALLQYPLQLGTPYSMPTHLDLHTGRTSTIDLAYISPQLYPTTTVQLGPDWGSDHCPILITLAIRPHLYTHKRRPQWKLEDDKWQDFKSNLPHLTDLVAPSVGVREQQMRDNIVMAAEETFSKTQAEYHIKYSKSWWSPACSRAVAERRRAKNAIKRHPTVEHAATYREKDARSQYVQKNQKKDSWIDHCNKLNSRDPLGPTWNQVGILQSKAPPVRSPLIVNGNIITTATDRAEAFADHFQAVFNNQPRQLTRQERTETQSALNTEQHPLNTPIRREELSTAIKSLHGTTPGVDMIHNNFFKHLSDPYREALLELFNQSLQEGKLIISWKHGLVVPIHKTGKQATECASFRPITLLPCMSKVMEKIICNRLYWSLEHHRQLCTDQSGFARECQL
jgi:hypothetical protein